MRHLRVIILAWLVTGAGAVLGAMAGAVFGKQGLFMGAMAGGTLAVLYAVRLLTTRGWLDVERRRGGAIGGLVGLALAAPLAVMNLDTPWIPVLVTSLVGIVLLIGAGRGAVR